MNQLPSVAIKQIFESVRLSNNALRETSDRDRRDHKQHRGEQELRKYLHTLQVAAQESNRILEQSGTPYRLSVADQSGSIVIKVGRYDKNGNLLDEAVRDITGDHFARWIEDISRIEGLFIDRTA
jgi:uncharacterized FlaG/YvyC family protein